MSVYGHTNINIDSIKRWANSLSTDNLTQVDIGGANINIDEETRHLLNLQIAAFSEAIRPMHSGDDWRLCLHNVSSLFLNAFIRLDNKSIRIGDFYECLIVPSNMNTYKKLIKGFDILEIGAIHISDSNGALIASIGEKSDLIWQVFFSYFINEYDNGCIIHTYQNHEQYLSIQLFNVEHLTTYELNSRMNEILLRVSMEYQMDFKVLSLDPLFKLEGSAPIYQTQFSPTGFEQIPMLYLTSAINSTDNRLAYLSYYQVMEYFFVRAQNIYFLEEFSHLNLDNINHSELHKTLNDYKKIASEKSALKLVLSHAVDIEKLKIWLGENTAYQNLYCQAGPNGIDISQNRDNIISHLVNRVYSYRCSIAHAKGDVDEFIAIPSLSEQQIGNELELLKFLAFQVIQYYSKI